ncbi:hypothetical protein [Kordia jejudonensis]|uniref:hypothetical protein n=1 Tax=Kordia jejudonensis TaxID=1348245 RepID=UPI0006294156|nr:hypothetical protein [Kordia jejudonensis]
MKKRNVNSLSLNKKSIANFANELKGGEVSNSGLQISNCPALCIVTKEGILCEEIKFPPLDAAPSVYNPYEPVHSDAAANASVDSPVG